MDEAEKEAISCGDFASAKSLHEISTNGRYSSYKDRNGRQWKSNTQFWADVAFEHKVREQLTEKMNKKLEKEFLEQKEKEAQEKQVAAKALFEAYQKKLEEARSDKKE